jgi:lipase ATG15
MNMALDWWDDEIEGPDVTTREDLLQFAYMAFNAYYPDNTTEWYDLEGRGWDRVRKPVFGTANVADSVRSPLLMAGYPGTTECGGTSSSRRTTRRS